DLFPDWPVPESRLVQRHRELSLTPESPPRVNGLYVLRLGLRLGTVEKHGFEPAHALAMSIPPARVRRRLDLTLDDPRTDRYLGGETLAAEGEHGWVLVTVDGYALGWGKRTGATVKNHYPKGLRRRG
ncbi:MAG TPA: RsmF rRNA methyltransferase first C-terminal domain-containing protein, partial [Longimicrobiaceae bacterium]|nr:RsmF rRNA methyltransferase first C-terminal domain-containing protein [Longimicrobiaceae bacterium]